MPRDRAQRFYMGDREAEVQAAVRHPDEPRDWCTVEGAKRLKARIEAFWADRGETVEVKLVDASFVAAMRSARCDIRSNMINGLPRKQQQAPA
jgi:hypothetical protein